MNIANLSVIAFSVFVVVICATLVFSATWNHKQLERIRDEIQELGRLLVARPPAQLPPHRAMRTIQNRLSGSRNPT